VLAGGAGAGTGAAAGAGAAAGGAGEAAGDEPGEGVAGAGAAAGAGAGVEACLVILALLHSGNLTEHLQSSFMFFSQSFRTLYASVAMGSEGPPAHMVPFLVAEPSAIAPSLKASLFPAFFSILPKNI